MMSPDNANKNNQIEVFKPGEPLLERRRTPHAPARIVEIEKAPDLLAYWKVIRKRRWTVLTAFIVLFGVVLVGTLKQKPIYRAKALLEIEKENPNLITPQELFQLEEVSDAYLETEYKVLSSEDLAERVITQLGLDQVAEFRPPKRSWPWTASKGAAAARLPAGASVIGGDPSIQETVLARFESR